MWSIPPPQRPIGQAYLVVAMHALGDVPSPPIVGALQGRITLDLCLHAGQTKLMYESTFKNLDALRKAL